MVKIKFFLFFIKTFELIMGVIIDTCDLMTNCNFHQVYCIIPLLTCILIRIVLVVLIAISIFKE